jgi:hypothetical protein
MATCSHWVKFSHYLYWSPKFKDVRITTQFLRYFGPCCSLIATSLASSDQSFRRPWLRRLVAGPGSCPVQSMWDLWWTKWHWDRFLSEFLGFPCQYHSTVAYHTHTSSGGRTIDPLVTAVQRHCVTHRHEQQQEQLSLYQIHALRVRLETMSPYILQSTYSTIYQSTTICKQWSVSQSAPLRSDSMFRQIAGIYKRTRRYSSEGCNYFVSKRPQGASFRNTRGTTINGSQKINSELARAYCVHPGNLRWTCGKSRKCQRTAMTVRQ